MHTSAILSGLQYKVDDNPPWITTILLGFQVRYECPHIGGLEGSGNKKKKEVNISKEQGSLVIYFRENWKQCSV